MPRSLPLRTASAVLVCALALAGCGADDPPAPSPAPPPTQPPAAQEPAEPAPERGDPEAGPAPAEPDEEGGLGPVGAPYRCGGQPVRRLDAEGPVRVDPPVITAGQPFEVVVTDRDAQAAVISLGGVSTQPIYAEARERDGRLTATLRMPAGADCGNKLLTVEGDVTAEAYVAVRE